MSKPEDKAAALAVFEFESRVQAGEFIDPEGGEASASLTAIIARAILAAKAEEREECAKVAMAQIEAGDENHESWLERYDTAISIALKIRKRGEA